MAQVIADDLSIFHISIDKQTHLPMYKADMSLQEGCFEWKCALYCGFKFKLCMGCLSLR